MPYLDRKNSRIYYEDSGSGTPVIALHGLALNSDYWNMTGLTDNLAASYRFISMDMRGHGKSSCNENNFTVEAIMDDITSLADSLSLDRFHLMGHSTGGMTAARYAMKDDSRLLSLVIKSTGSSTSYFPGTSDEQNGMREKFAAAHERFSWDQIIAYSKQNPFPFFSGIAGQPDNEHMWEMITRIFKKNDAPTIGSFIRTFYTDPDPNIAGLRSISCPALILIGELDHLMLPHAEIVAREIPESKHVILDGIGHMLAIEDPARTIHEILNFLT